MINLTTDQLYAWIAAFMWPMGRILGLVTTAPLLGNHNIPSTVRGTLVVAFTLIIAPVVPDMPDVNPASLAGLLIFAQQLVVGLAMGFVFQIVFAAVEMAGEAISMSSGLGFASFYDLQTRSQTSVIRQFLTLFATAVFLSANGHLALLSALVESFTSLPVAPPETMEKSVFWQLATWGKVIFRYGAQIALPVVTALLTANLALGILTRAAPQLNLFNIGFSFTLLIAVGSLALAIPYFIPPLEQLFREGMETLGRLSLRL